MVKAKFTLQQATKTQRGSKEYLYSFFNLGARWGVSGQRYAPAALPPRKRPGGWVRPRAGLDGCGKPRPSPGFDPRTVQPVASLPTELSRPTRL